MANPPLIPCLVCRRGFESVTRLQSHCRLEHPECRHACRLCHGVFTSTCTLNLHMSTQHPPQPQAAAAENPPAHPNEAVAPPNDA